MNSDINFESGPIVIMESCNSQPYHMHKNAQELIWLLEGEAGVTFNNKEYFLNEKDDLMLIVDADFHKVRKISRQLRYLSFYIDLPYFQRYIKDILNVGLYVNPGYRTQEQIPHLKKMRVLLAQMVREYQGDAGSQQVIEIATQLLLLIRNHFNFLGTTYIDYKDQHTFDRLFGVYDFVYQHYPERVTLADLADHIHVSQTYLSRSIKQLTGMSFTEILNYVRCEEALRLLLETDKSITTIAYDSGFSDPKYFHKYFEKFFYANPAEFRKNHKNQKEIDALADSRQREITYDDALRERLGQYWKDDGLYKSKATHLSFAAEKGSWSGSNPPDSLTVLVTKEELHQLANPGQLMQALERDFANIRIEIADSDSRKLSFGDAKMWPVELMQALKDRRVALQSSPGGWNGLNAMGRIKTPLYYMLQAADCAEGCWEYGNNWAACRNSEGDGAMLLLAWNGSLEQSIEFQIDFGKKEREYLFLEYEFSNSVLGVLSQVPAKSMKAMTHILRPALSAAMLRRGEEGHTFKIGPGKAGILSITKK